MHYIHLFHDPAHIAHGFVRIYKLFTIRCCIIPLRPLESPGEFYMDNKIIIIVFECNLVSIFRAACGKLHSVNPVSFVLIYTVQRYFFSKNIIEGDK